jgi:uncharacterized protein (TIGR03067 family)
LLLQFGFTKKIIAPYLLFVLNLSFVFVFATNQAAANQSAARDYQRLTGEWQLTSAVIDGKRVPQSQLKRTLLITTGNTFRFPQSSGVATHPAGRFTVNPNTVPKQVDSVAIGGKNAGKVTRGIYEIIDATHQRECWGPPGGRRPASFESPRGSKFILQYWRKIGPAPKT